MKNLFVLLLFIFSINSFAVSYVSFENEFVEFIKESENRSFEEQESAWIRIIESKAPEVYFSIYGSAREDDDLAEKRTERLKKFLPKLYELQNEIASEFKTFEKQAVPIIENLKRSNSDTNLSSIVVYAIPSLMRFNGQVSKRTVNGSEIVAVKFGLDMISYINKYPDSIVPGLEFINDLSVLATHEFTHALHFLTSDFGNLDPDTKNLLNPLWMEGIAQIYSQSLVLGTSYESMFMEKKLAERCTYNNVKKWAQEFLIDSRSQRTNYKDLYKKWFLLSSSANVPRAGYCLGYHIVLNASYRYSLYELARLSTADANLLSLEILEDIVK